MCVLRLSSTRTWSTLIAFPDWLSGSVYIQNVLTGMVIDVQGNVKANGTSVWPYSLNHSDAQIFRFSQHGIPDKYGDNARYISALNAGPDLVLSLKAPPLVIVDAHSNEPAGPGTVRSEAVLPLNVADLDAHRPTSKRTLRNFAFSIEEKRDLGSAASSSMNVATYRFSAERRCTA
jgi:hypothetical protein